MKKVVLITGCSSGFGKEIAQICADEFQVIATMRDLSKRNRLESELKQLNLTCDIQYCDVNNQQSIDKLIHYIQETYAQLHILVNNAGYGIGGYFEDLDEKEIKDQFETNFFGLQRMTRAALPLLRKSSPSKIINMSSIAGVTSTPCISAYNASKWAVEGFSESLLFECAPFNVDVVCVQPGQFKTSILRTI